MLQTKLERLIKNLHKIPDEFWVTSETGKQVIWLLSQEDGTAGSYETSQERIGITREGEMLWGFSSGCSCWSGWEKDNYCPTKSYKEFNIDKDFVENRYCSYYSENLNDWETPFMSTIDSFLFMISKKPDPKKVLSLQNAEVRRYMIKRVGYDNIKETVQAEVIHVDGDNELLKFNTGELYVKVKDSSTEREYLLFVEGQHKTCRSAIAWTFGLREHEYCPIVET